MPRPSMSNPRQRPNIHTEGVPDQWLGRFERGLLGMSRHHIVDIQMMGDFYDIGRIIIKHSAFDGSSVDRLQRVVASGGPFSNVTKTAPVGLSSQQPLRANFMWSPINLFSGPSATYRKDDPNDKAEEVKPISMSTARWGVLKSVERFTINAPRRGGGGFDGSAISLDVSKLYIKTLDKLSSLTLNGEGRIHIFQYKDWKISGTRAGGDFGYQLKKT